MIFLDIVVVALNLQNYIGQPIALQYESSPSYIHLCNPQNIQLEKGFST